MYYVGFCRVCKTGPLGLRCCGQCGNIVLLCDECDAVWSDADLAAPPQYAQGGDLPCPACEASLIERPSHWATEEQIQNVDWLQEAIHTGALELKQGTAFAPDAEDDESPERPASGG